MKKYNICLVSGQITLSAKTYVNFLNTTEIVKMHHHAGRDGITAGCILVNKPSAKLLS